MNRYTQQVDQTKTTPRARSSSATEAVLARPSEEIVKFVPSRMRYSLFSVWKLGLFYGLGMLLDPRGGPILAGIWVRGLDKYSVEIHEEQIVGPNFRMKPEVLELKSAQMRRTAWRGRFVEDDADRRIVFPFNFFSRHQCDALKKALAERGTLPSAR